MKKICFLVLIILGVSAQVKGFKQWCGKCHITRGVDKGRDIILPFEVWKDQNHCVTCNRGCGDGVCTGYKKKVYPTIKAYDNSSKREYSC